MEPRLSIITLGVSDLKRSYTFYHEGLGFPTSGTPESGIIFFQTQGVCLALYPIDKLAEDISPEQNSSKSGFSGVTIAHVARSEAEVNTILEQAQKAGGKIEKSAQKVFWGKPPSVWPTRSRGWRATSGPTTCNKRRPTWKPF